jgi:hypothetical protein
MWLSVRVSVVIPTECVERRTLCPSCGSRPRWASTVTRDDEVVEKNWWCPACLVLLQSCPSMAPSAPELLEPGDFIDESRNPMN